MESVTVEAVNEWIATYSTGVSMIDEERLSFEGALTRRIRIRDGPENATSAACGTALRGADKALQGYEVPQQ